MRGQFRKGYMKHLFSKLKLSGIEKAIMLANIFAAIYWIGSRFIAIYTFAAVGAVYEFLWLPVLFVLFILPLFSFLLWAGEKFKVRSANLFNLSMALITVFIGYLIGN